MNYRIVLAVLDDYRRRTHRSPIPEQGSYVQRHIHAAMTPAIVSARLSGTVSAGAKGGTPRGIVDIVSGTLELHRVSVPATEGSSTENPRDSTI